MDRTGSRLAGSYRRVLRCSTASANRLFLEVPSGPFHGFNLWGAKTVEGVVRNWWREGLMGATNAHYECIKAFSET